MTRPDRAPGAPDRLSRLAVPGRAGPLERARGRPRADRQGAGRVPRHDPLRHRPLPAPALGGRGLRPAPPPTASGPTAPTAATPTCARRWPRSTAALLGIPVDPARSVILTAGTQSALFAAFSALAGDAPVVLLDARVPVRRADAGLPRRRGRGTSRSSPTGPRPTSTRSRPRSAPAPGPSPSPTRTTRPARSSRPRRSRPSPGSRPRTT